MTLALVFPGQGSQSVGMMDALAGEFEQVRALFADASEALGYDLYQRVAEGPEQVLNQTQVTQPAMLVAGCATWAVWQSLGGPQPTMMAGHSLGEYTALTATGVLKFEDAVRLVELRARLMQEATPKGTGAMAALIGLEDGQVEAVCRDARQKAGAGRVVAAANYNAPGQVVIAGHADAVALASELATEAGARRAIPLPVSVPSHCDLMRPAAERLAAALSSLSLGQAAVPVLQNATVQAHASAHDIAVDLVDQLYSPVRWTQTITTMAADGIQQVFECGPGKVLAGLNKRIDRGMNCQPLIDRASIEQAIESCA